MYYHLYFYVPPSHLEQVKTALFNKGAGKIGNYDACCWEVLGQGQFRPLENSQPFVGKANEIEYVAEYKVDMVCALEHIEQVLQELITVHPYETPAYGVYEIYTLEDFRHAKLG